MNQWESYNGLSMIVWGDDDCILTGSWHMLAFFDMILSAPHGTYGFWCPPNWILV